MLPQATSYEDVLQLIRQWPPAQRLMLAQSVLQSLAPEVSRLSVQRNKSLRKALGLLATTAPAPTDAEVRAWLDERRSEKYG